MCRAVCQVFCLPPCSTATIYFTVWTLCTLQRLQRCVCRNSILLCFVLTYKQYSAVFGGQLVLCVVFAVWGLECLVAAWECAEQSSLGPRGGGGGCGGVGGQLVEVEEGNLPTAHCGLPAHSYLSASFSSQLVVVTVQLLPLLDNTASPLPLQNHAK